MGVSTPAQLATKMGALAAAVERIPKSALGKALLAGKTTIAAGAPARLRGVGKRGAKLGVRYAFKSGPGAAEGSLFATGPWALIESDTPAHVIPRERVRGRARVVVIPGVGVRAYAHHPGTKGQHPWAKGAAEVAVIAPRVFQAELAVSLATIF